MVLISKRKHENVKRKNENDLHDVCAIRFSHLIAGGVVAKTEQACHIRCGVCVFEVSDITFAIS